MSKQMLRTDMQNEKKERSRRRTLATNDSISTHISLRISTISIMIEVAIFLCFENQSLRQSQFNVIEKLTGSAKCQQSQSLMKQSGYESQNQQLYQLHLQRLKRKGEQIETEQLPKIVQKEEKQEKMNHPYGEIYLNTIIYDKREGSAKFNNITLAQLLHEDVRSFPQRPISKNVQSLLITTYGYESEVFEPIARSKIPFFIVNREGEEKDGYFKKKHNGFQNLTLISPPKSNFGYGVFHTKLWLIKFSTFLRVVVCTSNHHLEDWSVWQNAFWYHDCPLIVQTIGQTKDKSTNTTSKEEQNKDKATIKDFDFEKDFKETLTWVITEMQPKGIDVLNEMKIDFQRYSFKDISVILIPTLPGRFKGSFLDKVGIGKVKKIMGKSSLNFKKPIMTYNCTSLGKLDEKFIRELYFAFNPKTFQFYPEKFRLVYPTDRYIREQTCGEAQVLFLTKENYDKSEMRSHIFHKYEQSVFNGVLGGIPHLKTVIVEDEQSNSDRCVLYLGSHNFTRAAWGTYEKEGSQISCSNSQLGLLFINYSKKNLLQWLPYRYPPAKYLNTDRPFFKMLE